VSDPTTAAGLWLTRRRLLAMPGLQRSLMGRHPVSLQDELRSIIAELDRAEQGTDATWDRYGEGGPVVALENQVAALLGKPAAVMFPSGMMAQQSVLRVWSDRQGSRRIAIPGLSHLLHHEQDGPRLLNAFQWALLTTGATPGGVVPTVEHLAAIPGALGAALLELSLRDGGYLLPSWQELEAFSLACSDRGVPLHLDGAQIWESGPHLGHTPAQIAALADTGYVSF
jgi:threonine aldolase